jgi:hypothetical protein
MLAAKSKKSKKKIKQCTLSEFRAWLSGVEEMQPDEWIPNKTQWELIREKIDSIIVEEVIQTVTQQIPSGMINRQVEYQPQPQQFNIQPLPQEHIVPIDYEISPEAQVLLYGKGGKHKTPNLDTSDGTYRTSFE